MRKRFKSKKKNKYKKILILTLIYISFSITYNTLYKHYINNLSTEKLINKIIIDSKNKEYKSNNLDKLKSPEYILKLILNLDLNKEIKQETNTVTNIESSKYNILIYNTHDQEKYNDNLFNPYNILPDVKLVSNLLEEKLNSYNINTTVIRNSIASVLKENNWNYASSYKASRLLIEPYITNNNYNLIIDIHRDSSSLSKTYIEYNKVPYAKVLFVNGTEYNTYEENLNLANKLNNIINNEIPNISRGIIKKGGIGVNGIYNQDLSPNLLIIEVGGQYNKIEEVSNTVDILAKSIFKLLEGDSYR